ncbi:hypothetical protein [Polynucleobacter alcilacus]|nr:hypothetical protein [Polynucleobacter alcilacus]MBU3567095.1 hypothetical protein [Polynucleobacter alcilacus]
MDFIKGESIGMAKGIAKDKAKGKAKNKKGSKRCLDYLAEKVFHIPCE